MQATISPEPAELAQPPGDIVDETERLVAIATSMAEIMARHEITVYMAHPDQMVGADNHRYWENTAHSAEDRAKRLGSATPPSLDTSSANL